MVNANNVIKDNNIIYFRPLYYYDLERVNNFLTLSHNFCVENNCKNIIFYTDKSETSAELIRNFAEKVTNSTDKVIIMDPYIFDSDKELVQYFINVLSRHNVKLEIMSGKTENNPYKFRNKDELVAFELLLNQSYQNNVVF